MTAKALTYHVGDDELRDARERVLDAHVRCGARLDVLQL